ncbi:MAG: flavin monoamine oxidase family protein, partial [Bacteriovorax sp.]
MTSRRDFLVKTLAGATALVARRAFSSDKKDLESSSNNEGQRRQENTHDCIVIGAGFSGLTAAKDLSFPLQGKGHRTIILEASHRIGGRILTVKDPRFAGPVELGGTYLHVKPKSFPIGDDLETYGVNIKKIRRMLKGVLYDKGWEGHLRKEYEMVREWDIRDLMNFSKKIDKYDGPDMSARQWLDKMQYPSLGRRLVDLYLTGHVPGSLDTLSIRGFGADKYSDVEMGWNEYKFVDGYGHFLEQLTKGRGAHLGKTLDIRFGQVVQHIKYNKQGVEVTTRAGEVYRGKSVILAVSLGMLKSGRISFDPPLPPEKLDALSCMEMGDEAKVFLKFKKRFWPKDVAFLNRIDKDHEMCRTYHAPFYDSDEGNKVLAALFSGAEADRIIHMSDKDVIKGLCRDFDKMFPDAAPTYGLLEGGDSDPTYLRYQWGLDEFAMGADSFLKIGGEKSVEIKVARKTLTNPKTTPGLFWAGEVTSINPGCTHGAHYSGVRAASEVDSYLRLN